ncbi:uncharacterized protein LOC110235030 [Exaiptasia diaphana]|uniref:Uncharacterized protein n=1 Tax=Exaiptasia diaphana TaxID=2652724 RepID=A0A913WYK0_EXADI|nr:uncharacterized protein LOC110235030 [Exaiptasia diaphana]KXJ27577.1 hypothetical protein AC249_AIPGENE7588 [Exaiptasia diaphana]
MGFAVVSWKTQNGVPLEKEEFEAIALAKVIMMNNGKKEKGADVTMVYQKVLWGGTIHSLHDTKKEACDELNKEVPQVKTPVQQKRARKQKDYGDQYVEEISDAENNDETPKSSKGKASKKRQRTAAVDEITEKCDAIIVNEILNPVPPRVNLAEKEVSSDSDRESDGCSGNQPTKLKHPRFGGKQPKKHTLPKCISQDCKKVKLELDDTKKELEAVKQDLSKALDKISKCKL